MSLIEYKKKRSFKKTPEPEGKVSRTGSGKPLSFVVQKHNASHLHYDFRLELDGVLKSWAVPKGPSMNPADKRLAMMTEDHPMSYASFEGVIPKGQYGGGDVIVWDNGVYGSTETTDIEESRKKLKSGFFKGEMKFVLYGEKLKGSFALVRMKGKEENAWLLIKERDEYASKEDVTKQVESVISGKVLPRDEGGADGTRKKKPAAKAAAKRSARSTKADAMPHHVKPMLARLVDKPFDRVGWLFEVKWDGYRAIAEREKGRVKLYSRNDKPFTEIYAPVAEALKSIEHDFVLDGEIIALKAGRADFHSLQNYRQENVPLAYMVFDLLYLDGVDLRSQPLIERKKLLAELIPESDILKYSEHVEESGKKLFNTIRKEGIEGIVAKSADSPYRDGARGDEWLKVKSVQEQEAIIVGFTAPRGSRKIFGALVLAAHIKGELRYIGHSGGGFTEKEIKDIHAKLLKIVTKTSPLNEKVPVNSPITWVKPKYVCEIKFTEWTPDGHMRHPIYVGMRIDKKPSEVVREVPETVPKATKAPTKKSKKKIKDAPELTHLDKVYWPEEGYTKGDLLEYYERIASIILPYLKDRPQNLNRHPNGIAGKNFFQKNNTADLPDFVETKKIWSDSNNAELNYIVCNNKETLLYLANLGCIEINPWNSRVGSLEKPDYLILDLDPHGRPWKDLIHVAREVRKVLDLACEEHFPKTSGKSGLHIVVPLGARYSYDKAREFSELIMTIVHRKLPDITSLERNPKKREGKLYLDYLQNRFGQTLASAYSVRPYPGATVSTPLEWSEVKDTLDPSKFTIKTIFKRLEKKGDLWEPTQVKGVDLSDAIRCLTEHV